MYAFNNSVDEMSDIYFAINDIYPTWIHLILNQLNYYIKVPAYKNKIYLYFHFGFSHLSIFKTISL